MNGGSLAVTADIDSTALTTGILAFNDKNMKVGGAIKGPVEFYDLTIPSGKTLTPGASTTITVRHSMTIHSGGSYSTTNSPTLVLGGIHSADLGTYTDLNGTAVNLGTVTVSGSYTKTLASALHGTCSIAK